MQLFPIIQRICAVGVMATSSLVMAQTDHDDGHAHEPSQEQAALVESAPSDGPINTMCPVTTDEEVDPMFTAQYRGQTIGLCCRKCRTRFEENPEKYVSELTMLQAVSMTTPPEASHDEGAPAESHGEGESHEHPDDATESDGHDDGASTGGHDDAEPHDHAAGHDEGKSGLTKLIAWLGKFHPPATHLPIGMLIGAALAEAFFILTKRDFFRNAGIFCVVLAGFGAIGAATLGWFNGGFVLVDDEWVQTVHRWLGTTTTLLTILTLVLLGRASRASAKPSAWLGYRVSLFAAATMVGATGFFGGALVYGINHYSW